MSLGKCWSRYVMYRKEQCGKVEEQHNDLRDMADLTFIFLINSVDQTLCFETDLVYLSTNRYGLQSPPCLAK